MTDLSLTWSNDAGRADLSLDGADLATDDGLATAVLVSLFTDARVDADELPEGYTSRRGWWGDTLADDGDQIGSKLWLLHRRKQEPGLPAEAAGYAREALQWALDDGVAIEVEASAEWTGPGELALRVGVMKPDGTLREFQFAIRVL